MEDLLTRISLKKQKLDSFRPLSAALVSNLDEWFKVELTYTSNAIEGNTLSRKETALVVEKGITVSGKTLREHLEAINHAEALEYVKTLVGGTVQDIDHETISKIHSLILRKIDDQEAGRYRTVPVRIQGANVIFPNPAKIPELMVGFIEWLHQIHTDHPVKTVVDAHFRFVSIHPFVDGNGRTARLLMNLLLMQSGYPPALIRKEDREAYIDSLEKGQTGGNMEEYYRVMYKAVNRSLDIYLEAADGTPPRGEAVQKRLLKIGELVKETGESVHTIRHWTEKGLLEIAERTEKGYSLYDRSMITLAKKIRTMSQDGMSLEKIAMELERIH